MSLNELLKKNWVRYSIFGASFILSIALILLLRDVTTPLFLALVIAYLGDPIIDKFEEWKINRTWGIILLLFILALFGTAFLLYLIPKFINQINELSDALPSYIAKQRDEFWPEIDQFYQKHKEDVDRGILWLREKALENGSLLAKSVGLSVVSSFKSVGSFIASLLGWIVVPVLAFYLLRDFDIMREKVMDLFPLDKKEKMIDLFSELHMTLMKFIKGQFLVALILAAIYSIGLTISGCPASLLIGLIAGFANLVPYLGIAIGFGPAIVLSYLSGGGPAGMIGVSLTFILGQMLEGMVITPKVVGESVGLHPVIVMIAIMLGGTYFGVAGMILALPAAAVLLVFIKRSHKQYLNSPLYLAHADKNNAMHENE
ncbi:MAG: AI-2E family transporter [Acidobacteria bacterium]|nr:MAG: AI-2E family transporter [Acidobacteriota bacterium]PIE90374.1 MAG: AI-2E family transporter [Acidobacteriota bacterium]